MPAAPRLCALAMAAAALTGCTTIASGVVVDPPGVNRHSYRQCLARNGFFTDHALVGQSREEYVDRHAADPPPTKPVQDPRRLEAGPFVVLQARIIRDGLFPHLQYGGGTQEDLAAPAAAAVAEAVHNRPYIVNAEGAPYASPSGAAPPPVGPPSRIDIPVNRFLDCYLAPVGFDEGEFSVTGDYDVEGRLLRAHVLLTMLTAFGTELVTSHPSRRQPEEAARLLAHVRDAEISLRAASPTMNPALRSWARRAGLLRVEPPAAAPGAPPRAAGDPAEHAATLELPFDRAGATPLLRWQAYATRLLRVFQIGVDIEVIDAHRSLDGITNVLAAFSNPTGGALDKVLQQAVSGMATVQKVQLYGEGMRRDAAETLAEHRLAMGPGAPMANAAGSVPTWRVDVAPETLRWRLWDAKLDSYCRLLAAVAKQNETGCVPKAEALKEAFEGDVPGAQTATVPK